MQVTVLFMSRDLTANIPTVPTIPVAPSDRVLVIAASTRTQSVNRALAQHVHDSLADQGTPAGLVDLGDYEMPLYHADLEVSAGVPDTTRALAARVAAAEVLVIVSPEYNGAFTPLLKNTIDWLTRIDSRILAHVTVLLASASPGRGGGANGLAMVAHWMANMGVQVADTTLSVGGAEIGPDSTLSSFDAEALADFATQATVALGTHRS